MVKMRNFKDSDTDLLVSYLNVSDVTKYITDAIPNPYTIGDAHYWINEFRDSEYVKAIELNGEFVGCISAKIGSFEYNCGAELGYWVARDFWNKGIATEAVRVFTALLFQRTSLVRLFVSVVSSNGASIRVLEKNGYELEGTLKKVSCKNGIYYDEHILSIISAK